MNLIVGIDPGATIGFAFLDIQGEFICTGFAKELGKYQLVNLFTGVFSHNYS